MSKQDVEECKLCHKFTWKLDASSGNDRALCTVCRRNEGIQSRLRSEPDLPPESFAKVEAEVDVEVGLLLHCVIEQDGKLSFKNAENHRDCDSDEEDSFSQQPSDFLNLQEKEGPLRFKVVICGHVTGVVFSATSGFPGSCSVHTTQNP